MSIESDAQASAATNAHTDSSNKTSGSNAVPVRPVTDATVPVFVTATPQQLSATKNIDLYINITTAASLTISMGPTSAGTGVTLNAAESDTLGLIHIFVPVGWYVKLTGTMADMAFNAIAH